MVRLGRIRSRIPLSRVGGFVTALLFWATVVVAIFAWGSPAGLTIAAPPTGSTSVVSLYHPDPAHLWNRLYGALYLRQAADGQFFGLDQLDPLLWAQSIHL